MTLKGMNIMYINIHAHSVNKVEELNNSNREIMSLQPAKGDIDELIFPDDEPYYISER